MEDTYQGILGLDRLPANIKNLNLMVSFIAVIWIAIKNYFRVPVPQQMPLGTFLDWLAWINPTCIAIAWLRMTGVKWKQTVLFFIAVFIVFKVIMFIHYLLVGFIT